MVFALVALSKALPRPGLVPDDRYRSDDKNNKKDGLFGVSYLMFF